MNDLKIELPARVRESNKGTYGKVLIIAGSKEICGAAILAANSAFRSGCGMVKVITHENNRTPLMMAIPECMVRTYGDKISKKKIAEDFEWSDCVLIGPGIGKDDLACKLVKYVLDKYKKPIVIDADGLNIIANNLDWLKECKNNNIIITPHVAEMSRLCHISVDSLLDNRKQISVDFARDFNVVVVCKDYITVVTNPNGEIYINEKGNSGLAKAGSGDVLAGLIISLVAQKMKMFEASCVGCSLHGLSAERAAEHIGEAAIMPSDLWRFY